MKRGWRQEVTTTVGGVTAQTLRHIDVLLTEPWRVTLAPEVGFAVARPTVVQVPSPAAYIVLKVLVLARRMPAKRGKDLLYLHDTFSVFTDALPLVREAWNLLKPRMVPGHVRTFEKSAHGLVSRMSDTVRDAARIAADRPRPPTPEILLAGLRLGFAGAFDIRPAEDDRKAG